MALSITKATVGGSEDTWGTTTNTALDAIVSEINNNADGTNATTPNITSFQIGGVAVTSTAAELNKLDGATVTTNEINILDGNTSATSTTVVDADRVVFNDDGTMKQVAMSDIATYINASSGGGGGSSGTVTSVGLSVPTGLSVSGSPVTTSGTLAISLASGYVIPQSSQIPSTSDISNYNTAYGWGNHASAGYLTTVSAGTGISVSTSGSTVTISSTATVDTSSVLSSTAGASVGAVGTYAMLEPTSSLSASSTGQPGTTHSGSSLKYSDTNGTDGSNPSGTWRLMGNVNSLHRSVYLRIS